MTPYLITAAGIAALCWLWWLACDDWETSEHLHHPNDGDDDV